MARPAKASQAHSSNLLRPNESETAFNVLGNKSVSLSTTVAQLYIAHPDPRKWTKHRTGVLCFVKDNGRKSYFIRMVDITSRSVVYDQELFEQFEYRTPKAHFHTFAGDKYMVGLNFADTGEAKHFRDSVQTKINAYQQKKVNRQQKKSQPGLPAGGPPGMGSSGMGPPGMGAPPSQPPQQHTRPSPPQPAMPMGGGGGMQANIPANVTIKNDKGTVRATKGGRKRISKSDISGPSNFVHVQHVGFDPEKGFDLNNLDSEWSTLFSAVGVTKEQLQDKDTAQFIYDFVQTQGGIEVAAKQLKLHAPPPPPHATRSAAPAIPTHRNRAPPPPTRVASGGHGAPPPPPPTRGQAPPPPSRSSAPPPLPPTGGPVPPPPPVPGIGAPPPPPVPGIGAPPPPPGPPPLPSPSGPVSPSSPSSGGRGDLLSQIHQGMSLKPVQPSEDSGSGDVRGGLLEAIRKGTDLKRVSESEKRSPPPDEELGGMAGALARALQDRSKVIQVSDDEEDDYDEDEDSDEWDD